MGKDDVACRQGHHHVTILCSCRNKEGSFRTLQAKNFVVLSLQFFNPSPEKIAYTNKFSNKRAGRIAEYLINGSLLLNPSLVHHGHLTGQGEGFFVIMGD